MYFIDTTVSRVENSWQLAFFTRVGTFVALTLIQAYGNEGGSAECANSQWFAFKTNTTSSAYCIWVFLRVCRRKY